MDAAYFPEGQNNSCSLLRSMKLESSSFGSGSGMAWAPFILRARSSRKKKQKDVEMKVQRQGVAALVRKLQAPALSQQLWQICARISSLIYG